MEFVSPRSVPQDASWKSYNHKSAVKIEVMDFRLLQARPRVSSLLHSWVGSKNSQRLKETIRPQYSGLLRHCFCKNIFFLIRPFSYPSHSSFLHTVLVPHTKQQLSRTLATVKIPCVIGTCKLSRQ